MPTLNDWNVPYSVISFFENALNGHDKVRSVARTQDILFEVVDTSGRTLTVLLVNDYSLGMAAVLRARREFPALEYIVTGGNWNGYTPEAKQHGRDNSIGIFNTGEFFGALNWTSPKAYYQKDADGNPVYNFKTA